MLLALSFPTIEQLVEWPNAIGEEGSWYGFNKIALINLIAVLATTAILLAARHGQLIPRGAQNLAEASIAFIRDGIIAQTIGPNGLRYLPPSGEEPRSHQRLCSTSSDQRDPPSATSTASRCSAPPPDPRTQ